jgi:CDP-diacylglycerol--serine O-phosphatidyltransferase
MFARVTRRHQDPPPSGLSGEQIVYPRPDRAWRRIGGRRHESARPAAALTTPDLAVVHQTGPVDVASEFHVLGAGSATGAAVVGIDHDGTATKPARLVGPATVPLLPGDPTPARRLKFAVANGCTVASLVLGMSAAFLAIRGNLVLAACALLACVAFDGLDGALARRFGVASPFGAQMDSMADLGSFGVGTGIVVYQWLVTGGSSQMAAAAACALVAVCAAIRLARFNVSPKDGRFFSGVPTTMAAAALALNTLIGPNLSPGVQIGMVAVCALAMVTSFPYVKLARLFRLPLWLWAFPAICAMISLPVTFATMVALYLVSGPVLWMYFRRRRVAITPSGR